MTRFGLSSDSSGNPDPAGTEGLLGLTAAGRHFSAWRANQPFSSGIPSSFDSGKYNGSAISYRNEEHARHITDGLDAPTGVDLGGVDTTPLYWNLLGDASDIHTPTGGGSAGSLEHDAWWRARKVDIANMVTAQGGPPYRPYLLSWHHEQRVNGTTQIGVGASTGPNTSSATHGLGTALEYAAAFRHVAAIMNDSTGPGALRDLGMLKMCMVPVLAQFMCDPVFNFTGLDDPNGQGTQDVPGAPSKISLIDPGSNYVDLYGIDWYPDCTTNNTITPTIHDQLIYFDAVHQWSFDRGRQWVIGEWGARTSPTDLPSTQRFAQVWAAAAPRIETYGTGPGSCYAWMCSQDAITSPSNPAVDDGSGRIQAVHDNIVAHPYYVFLGDLVTKVLVLD